ncbi:MAG: serine/threonine protein kinase [Tabrizicola sp.]|jgi:hypothetical protein|nr:serine/threonine protein kinase [Tabrizicola sp.]
MTAAVRKIDLPDAGPSPDELAPGTRLLLGQFTIQSFVNSGGFGIVYLAKDSLDRQVVVKECFPSTFCRRIGARVGARSRAQQDEFRSAVRNFVQEAVTLSELDHPNIIRVHQVFEDNDTAYMAMDYIKGHDLLETVEGSAPPLAPKEIMAHLVTMLDAVGHVHGRGLLHRDISPDNMILDQTKGQPVLIDFGASRKDVTRKSRAVSGLRIVKDGYSPQEFYVSGSKQAPCSDLYALAASFYHLISGETPKTSQERLAAIAGREGDPLRPLSGRFKAYPPEFLRAIDKAMSIFPRDRLQSVEEWQAMLGVAAAKPVEEPEPEVVIAAPVAAPAATPMAEVASVAEATALPIAPTPGMDQPAPATVPPDVATIRAARAAGGLQTPKDVLTTAAAATLLLIGLLALPAFFKPENGGPAVASLVPAPEPIPTAENLALANMVRLPNGLTFKTVDTATGTLTVVSEVPVGLETDLQTGDVLLFYAATGETLGTAMAFQEILQREFASGVTTYSFVIRRGAATLDAAFRLGAGN